MASMKPRRFIFFRAFSPCSTLQVTWTRNVSQVTTVPLSGGQPSRLTKSFVEYYRFRLPPVATLQVTWIRNASQVATVAAIRRPTL